MAEESETQLLARLSAAESTVSQLSERLTQLETRFEQTLLLLSDTYRYGKLQELLAAGRWQEADGETTRIMIDSTRQASLEEITPEDLQKFPCSVLSVIDTLWGTYSQERFGFSVQLRLYQSLGGSMDTIRTQSNEFLMRAGEQLGWRQNGKPVPYDDYDFSLTAPVGGLPRDWWHSPYGAKMANFFLGRLITCEL
ncbi:MAG: GUN4 domain-containing protein [Chloroflexaceae bacterium]|nr:GUN4 domain-containing protein [Chloroflexaceae bacterium]